MKILLFIIILHFFILEGFSFARNIPKYKRTNKYITNKAFPRNLEDDNYIIIIFNQDCYYSSGFLNIKRHNIDYIINEENKNIQYTSTQTLNIHKGYKIEIHFNNDINDLNFFFSRYYDPYMRYLESIDFTNFNSTLVSDISGMFEGCNSLKFINFLNFDTSNILDMNITFHGCSSLESIDLSKFDTSKVTNMGHMFYNCSSLKSIDLSNFDTSNVNDMSFMFYGCNSLESIDLSNFVTSKVTNMSAIFYNCISLKSIELS